MPVSTSGYNSLPRLGPEMREVSPGGKALRWGHLPTGGHRISIPSSTPEVYYDLTVEATANYIGEGELSIITVVSRCSCV